MKTHTFTIIASGLDPEADDFEDRFFDAGCDEYPELSIVFRDVEVSAPGSPTYQRESC